MTWIQTYSGKKFSFVDPQPEDVCIEDIAEHLGKQCRFVGATKEFYSIAQHSVFVSKIVSFQEYGYAGLLHDAGEAYYGDISSPLKMALSEFVSKNWALILNRIDIVVSMALNVPYPLPESVKHADLVALATERRDLMLPCDLEWPIELPEPHPEIIRPWYSTYAIDTFYRRYEELK